MAAATKGRVLALAASAAVVVAGSPLVDSALGATAFSGTTSSNPPPSNNVVAANRPQIVATFNRAVSTKSTMTLVAKGSSTNLCGPVDYVAGDSTHTKVACTPTSDLLLGTTYDAVTHGISADGSQQATTPTFEFTVNYPKFDEADSTPPPGGSEIDGGETLTAAFDQPVTGDANTAFQVFEIDNGTRGANIPGTVGFTSATPVVGGTNGVTWKPNNGALAPGKYEAVVVVNGENSDGSANKAATGTADYFFYVAGTTAPTLTGPGVTVNNQTETKVPFSGTAAPGLTVTVTVTGNDATTNQIPTSVPASATVASCGAATCPYTVSVDVSSLHDGNLKASAQAADSNSSNTTNTSPTVTVVKDTSAPNPPTLPQGGGANPSISADGFTVTVSATDSDTTVANYLVTITDGEKHAVTQTYAANATHDLDQKSINVSNLDNGTITVSVQALDRVGNASTPAQDSSGNTPTLTKNSPLYPNLAASTLTGPSGDVTFVDAESRPVQPPSKITIGFDQAITLSYTPNPSVSNPNPSKQNSSVCFTTPNGTRSSCFTPTLSGDRALQITLPSKSPLADGVYRLAATTFTAACPGTGCQTFNGQVTTQPGGTTPFTFTVDGTPPTINVTSLTSPVVASNYQSAAIKGTTGTDVSQLAMTFKSSNAPKVSPKAVTVPVTSGSWSLPLAPALSKVTDGTITVTIKGSDAAGNTASVSRTFTLSALALRASAGDGHVTLRWTRPQLAGGAAPTYTLQYIDTTTGAPLQTVSPPPSSSATSITVRNLANGHHYAFGLHAGDSSDNGPSAIVTATPASTTHLTLHRSASTVVYHHAVTLSGQLTIGGGAGLTGRVVKVYVTYANGHHGKTRSFTTATSHGKAGYWSGSFKPYKNVTYRAVFGGDSTYAASSASTHVGVRVAIHISSIRVSGTRATIKGAVAPSQARRHVYLYEHTGSGNHRLGRATLTSSSTFTFKHSFSRGKHRVFARFYKQNNNLGHDSSRKSFTV